MRDVEWIQVAAGRRTVVAHDFVFMYVDSMFGIWRKALQGYLYGQFVFIGCLGKGYGSRY